MCCTVQKISDLRAALGGGADQGILSPAFENGIYVSSHPLSTAMALHCPKACAPPLPKNNSHCISGLPALASQQQEMVPVSLHCSLRQAGA